MIGDLRIALFLAYTVLVTWQGRRYGGAAPNWWEIVILFAALNLLLTFAERLQRWWADRRAIQHYRAMDPALREERINRIWLGHSRRWITEQLGREGHAEVGGMVERFPFARGAHVATQVAFSVSCALGIALLVPLVAVPYQIAPFAAWTLWACSCISAFGAAWTRKRLGHLETVLEISRFGIAEVGPSGRRVLRWGDPLVLTAKPLWRRLELRTPGTRDYIALDFDRISIDRAIWLVIDYAGFATQLNDAGTGAG